MKPGLVSTRFLLDVADIITDILDEFLSDYLVIGTE
jgi:hypothetical protein